MRRHALGLRSGVWMALLVLSVGMAGCSGKDVRSETVATVNGDEIKVSELREFLGIRGGGTPASSVPAERKKEALERLIGGRLLATEARTLGLDNTKEFREAVERNGQGVLITALFRKEVSAKLKLSGDEVRAEAGKIRSADNTVSEPNAKAQAEQALSDRALRKIEEELIAAAKKEFPPAIDNGVMERIGKGEKVADDAVLATVAGEKVTYGEVKGILAGMAGGTHGGQDLSRNPVAVSRMLDRETIGKALSAYAKKQGIEGSEWKKQVQADLERSILIDLLAEKEVLQGIEVTDKEVKASYEEHGQMFVSEGKKIPLSQVKEQIRQFLGNEKRKQALEAYIGELRKKAKVTVNEAALPKV